MNTKIKTRVVTSVKIKMTTTCRLCNKSYQTEIILNPEMDAYFQLGYFVHLLNSLGEIKLKVSKMYLDKVDNIAKHLERQGNIVKIYEEQDIKIKSSKNIDVYVYHIIKGKTQNQIIDMCKNYIIDNPKYKVPIIGMIERITNGN